jgi:hypothetical protein
VLTNYVKNISAKPARTRLVALAESGLFRLLVVTLAIFLLMGLLNGNRFLSYRNFASMCFQFP